MRPAPKVFMDRLVEKEIPLDPGAACRLIRRMRTVWMRPGVRYRPIRIGLGRCRGAAIVVWDTLLDVPVTAYWRGGSPPPPRRRLSNDVAGDRRHGRGSRDPDRAPREALT